MSAPAAVAPLRCSICGRGLHPAEAKKIRFSQSVRCVAYEACMVRATENKRKEIDAPRPYDAR